MNKVRLGVMCVITALLLVVYTTAETGVFGGFWAAVFALIPAFAAIVAFSEFEVKDRWFHHLCIFMLWFGTLFSTQAVLVLAIYIIGTGLYLFDKAFRYLIDEIKTIGESYTVRGYFFQFWERLVLGPMDSAVFFWAALAWLPVGWVLLPMDLSQIGTILTVISITLIGSGFFLRVFNRKEAAAVAYGLALLFYLLLVIRTLGLVLNPLRIIGLAATFFILSGYAAARYATRYGGIK